MSEGSEYTAAGDFPYLGDEILQSLGGAPAVPGTVHLVGGGPGALGLVTARAAMLLATATFVAYDRLSPPEALSICREDAERVYVGKLPDRHALPQPEIDALLVDRARDGHAVVRFKGGDPFVFGRGSEEAQACVRAGVPFEIVPGVTSAIAAPAFGGIPVTHRGTSPAFAVITGHEDPTKPETQVDYATLAAFPGTLIFLMGVGRIGRIAEQLMAQGRAATTPVSMVRWGTTPRQEQLSGTLGDIAEQVERTGFGSPAVTVIGEVAGLAGELAWFGKRPLHGRTVLVPRTRSQASALSRQLRALGAQPVEAPTIRITPPDDLTAVEHAATMLRDGAYGWVAFTSTNAVAAMRDAVERAGGDTRWFAACRIASIGGATSAALRTIGLVADLEAPRGTSRELGTALVERLTATHQTDQADAPPAVLLPRADIATETLPDVLDHADVPYTRLIAYRTVPATRLPDGVADRLLTGGFDAVALSSSSTARNLMSLLDGSPHESIKFVSVGPSTTATCNELGLAVAAEADTHDMDGLAAAVVRALT